MVRVCPVCRIHQEDDTSSCPNDGAPLISADSLPADGTLEEGTMVGEYRIEHKLGSGAFGDVYAAEHPLIGKRVAIKVLNPNVAFDSETVSRFIAEARAVNKIRHKNIVDVFLFNVLPDARNYFVMELLEGRTLAALLTEKRRLPIPMALDIARGVASALDAAHEVNITHRDLKPENVFLVAERDGTYFPKLLDFGIAKLTGDDVAHETQAGMLLGTPRYMSPEQARGKRVDHRSDIYSFGVMLHEMLTGSPPFTGTSALDVLVQHDTEQPPRMSDVAKDLPRELDAPVLAMLAKQPKARPASAGEAIAALAKCAENIELEAASAEQPPAILREDAEARSFAATVFENDRESAGKSVRTGQSTDGVSAVDTASASGRTLAVPKWTLVAAAGMLVAISLWSLIGKPQRNVDAGALPSSTSAARDVALASSTAAPSVVEVAPSATPTPSAAPSRSASPESSLPLPIVVVPTSTPREKSLPKTNPSSATPPKAHDVQRLDSILGERE